MNTKKRIINALAFSALFVGILAVVGVGPTAQMQTGENPRIHATLYGLHSLSAGQTARLTVINPEPLSERQIIPCIRVRMVFDTYDAIPPDQQRLRFARRVEREVELDPGEAASFDFSAGRGGDHISAASFVRPLEPGRVAAISTLEVREAARTIFTLPGIRRGFDPQPDPPVGD